MRATYKYLHPYKYRNLFRPSYILRRVPAVLILENNHSNNDRVNIDSQIHRAGSPRPNTSDLFDPTTARRAKSAPEGFILTLCTWLCNANACKQILAVIQTQISDILCRICTSRSFRRRWVFVGVSGLFSPLKVVL